MSEPDAYKLHLACDNGEDEPLDVFVRSRTEWDSWNAWRDARDQFSRKYIFALIDFYPESDVWLFGGAYEILSRDARSGSGSYRIQLLHESEPFIGRLKVRLKRPGRSKAFNFENHYHRLTVAEILTQPYTGEVFPGYDSIDVKFSMLESIFAVQRADWRST